MNSEQDVFTQDIGIGGIRSKFGIRILMCYILKNVNSIVSKSAFTEILRSAELVNFFEIGPALDSLKENGLVDLIEKEDDEYYSLTEEGKSVAEKLQFDIPKVSREKALSVAFGVVSRERLKGIVDYKIEKANGGYYVICTVTDNDELMMQTKLFAADYMQAQLVGERFLEKPERLYSGIIDALTH